MSNLSDFFGGTPARGSGSDPHRQPAFSQYYSGESNLHPTTIHYDHALRVINRQTASGSGTPSNRTQDWTTDVSVGQLGFAQPSTSQYQVYQNQGAQTGTNTFLGSTCWGPNMGSCPSPVATTSYTNMSIIGKAIRLNGTSIGLDQHYALFTLSENVSGNMTGATAGFYITPRSVVEAQQIYQRTGGPGMGTLATRNYVKVQAAGVLTNGYIMACGGVSYNQRTKKLVIMERATGGNGNWRPILIHNAPNPAEYINNNSGYQTALTAAAAVSGARIVGGTGGNIGGVYGGSNEMTLRIRPVLSDDNSVTFLNLANENNKIAVVKWPWTGALIGGSFAATTILSDRTTGECYSSTTNTVGDNCGSGAQWQMSLDGKTVMLSSNSYYWGAGLQYVLINTVTGGLSKLILKHDTTHAHYVVPVGASNFLIMTSENTDSTGIFATKINWNDYDVYSGGTGTYTGVLTQPANWRIKLFDSTYYTTAYPTIHQHIGVDNKAIVAAENGTWQA